MVKNFRGYAMETKNIYKADLPYPEINCKDKNKSYASLIQINYAGAISELTSINQYIYHSLAMFEKFEDIACCLKNIAKVEMEHLEILGKLIIALGGNPRFEINKGHWSPKFIEYGSNFPSMLHEDIDGEKAAIRQYRRTIELIKDENITEVLERIVKDEEIHIKTLVLLYNEICRKR
jgi:bacterioferritin